MQVTLKNKTLDLRQPEIMGVLNVTPDSFSDGQCYLNPDIALRHARDMVQAGARILDIGGESTRPGAVYVDAQTQLERIMPVIERIRRELDVIISVDTSEPAVIQAVDKAGAHMINDIRALQTAGALEAVAHTELAVCLMHMQGTPETMQQTPHYMTLIHDICHFLIDRVSKCMQAGIAKNRILLDPGFGFGKSLQHNCQLLDKLDAFHQLGYPLLVGMSRKSMLGALTDAPVGERVHASVAAALLAVMKGAHIVRVHDVAATAQTLRFYQQWRAQCL